MGNIQCAVCVGQLWCLYNDLISVFQQHLWPVPISVLPPNPDCSISRKRVEITNPNCRVLSTNPHTHQLPTTTARHFNAFAFAHPNNLKSSHSNSCKIFRPLHFWYIRDPWQAQIRGGIGRGATDVLSAVKL